MKRCNVLLMIGMLVNALPIFTMEKPSSPVYLSPIEEDVQVRSDVLRALTSGVLNQDNDENLDPKDLEQSLLLASPGAFCKDARARMKEYLDERCESKGVTSQMRQSHMLTAEKDIDLLSYADQEYSPAPSPIKKEVAKVAAQMKLAEVDVRKAATGHTAYMRSNVLVYDPACVAKVAPTTPDREALWAHELNHFKENDLAERLALERAFREANVAYSPDTKGQQARFYEVFADAQGACKSPKSAKAALRLIENDAEVAHDVAEEDHPTQMRRAAIVKSMVAFHEHYPTELKRKSEREENLRAKSQRFNAGLQEASQETAKK